MLLGGYMKKVIVILFVIVVVCLFISNKENVLIPSEAIRFRIIANSDELEDQELKNKIKDEVEDDLYKVVSKAKNINEARSLIKNNISNVDSILEKYDITYGISYGDNYFPEKYYKGYKYDEGNYESLVITLGKGLGHNWWCVLFPPLCLLDEQNDLSNAEYSFYVSEVINKFK